MTDPKDTLASHNEIGKMLAQLQAQPKAEPKAEPAERHEQLAADLNAAQSKWFTCSELAGGPMPRKPTAHAEHDQLSQQAASERVKARDLEAQLEVAEDQLEDAAEAITEGHAADDQKAVTAARKSGDQAVAAVKDLRHRVEGARLRVDRTQAELDTFLRERARDPLAEREPQARTVAMELARSLAETLRLAKAYVAERRTVHQLVAAVPGATPPRRRPSPRAPLGAGAQRTRPGLPRHPRAARPVAQVVRP